MLMRKKIKNTINITCTGLDLTTVTGIEFYIRQKNFFGEYSPTVISPSEMIVVVPFEDAKKLTSGTAELQFAFVDADGNPSATDIVIADVGNLLKEKGYDPV